MFTLINPTNLEVFSNERDLLRDLFTYLDYVSTHSIKRMTRTNEIPRADSVRLAKLLGDPELAAAAQESGGAKWIDFIDKLAYQLHLVNYDIKGKYRGESSQEPQFIENYITINPAGLQKFSNISPIEQEKRIIDVLKAPKSMSTWRDDEYSEFFQASVLGRLDSFNTWGSGTGIVPTLKFPAIREFLLDVLAKATPGQWYSTESLIGYLKHNHPYFLIPENTPKADRWGKALTRYDNFYESRERWGHDATVPVNAPDAFERVEGRYVERFLENIPLIMRFVDVAYDPAPYTGLLPSRGMLKAFRVNERLLRLMNGEAAAPKVTVQPNFDVIVEADFYPAQITRQIAALGELVSSPHSGNSAYIGIFQLNKAAVAAEQVRQPGLDVLALLRELTGRELPNNVQIELEEWAGHADQFTLYEGFALLENVELAPLAESFIIEQISPTLSLVHRPEALYTALETDSRVPLRVQHTGGKFSPVAQSAVSVFPKESAPVLAPKTARQVKVSRVVTVSYKFPDEESFTFTQKMLAELRCPFHADAPNRIISIQQKEQGKFDEALRKLQDDLIFEIE